MKSPLRSLLLCVSFTAACTEIIGLSSYEEVGGEPGAGAGGEESEAGRNPGGRAGSATGGGGTGGSDPVQGGDGGNAPHTAGAGGVESQAGSGGAAGSVNGGEAGQLGGGTGGAGGESTIGGGSGASGAGGSPPLCEPQELLVDAGFDLSSPIWEQDYPLDAPPIISAEAIALSQPNVAWLGGIDPVALDPEGFGIEYITEIWQDITIPETAPGLAVSCAVWVDSTEVPMDGFEADEVGFYLSNPQGLSELVFLGGYVDDDVTVGWVTFERTLNAQELNLVRGRTVAFDIFSYNDESAATSFFVDDCSVRVLCE